jgi:hypothetical protein
MFSSFILSTSSHGKGFATSVGPHRECIIHAVHRWGYGTPICSYLGFFVPTFPLLCKKMYRGCVVFDFFLSQLELPEIHKQNDVWSMDGFNTCCSSVSLVYWLLLPGILPASHNRSTNFNWGLNWPHLHLTYNFCWTVNQWHWMTCIFYDFH